MGHVNGLDLSERFYAQVVRPIAGGIPHAAALLGEGSEVLGFDTERSTDHAWGPRAHLFVSEGDVDPLRAALDDGLPNEFEGRPVRYFRWQTGRVEHHVEVATVEGWFAAHVGLDPRQGVSTASWLALPQQLLLEATAGRVFHDDDGGLTRARHALAWYPHDVWLWLMACQWNLIQDDEPLIGRAVEVGDLVGARVIAARVAERAMRLAFLQERAYAPYPKWLGTSFSRLAAAPALGPLLEHLLTAVTADDLVSSPAAVYRHLARRHNELGVTPPVAEDTGPFDVGIAGATRPYEVLNAGRFVKACIDAIAQSALRSLKPVGSVDQLTHADDLLIHFTDWPQRLAAVYQSLLDAAV